MTGADFTGAVLRSARLGGSIGFTADQLYSTASYQAHDLTGIQFSTIYAGSVDLAGWNLVGQNLTGAFFWGARLTDANLSQANLTRAMLYANLTDANLSQANLTDADLGYANVTGANFTQSEIRGAHFTGAIGFTAEQLYSTASYQAHDLTGILLGSQSVNDYVDHSGWNLAHQNLSNSSFQNNILTDADLSQANLTAAYFGKAVLTGTT